MLLSYRYYYMKGIKMENYLNKLGISDNLISFCNKCENELKNQFDEIDSVSALNHAKVLKAFQDFNVSETFFNTSTGYGYDDFGRDNIEKIFAKVLDAEDALVRIQFVSRNTCTFYCIIFTFKTTEILLLALMENLMTL